VTITGTGGSPNGDGCFAVCAALPAAHANDSGCQRNTADLHVIHPDSGIRNHIVISKIKAEFSLTKKDLDD
jgi:hypothetical protein